MKQLLSHQKINHFPGTFLVARKDNLYHHINHQLKKFPREYNFAPKTYIVSKDWEQFLKDRKKAPKKKLWIYKPSA